MKWDITLWQTSFTFFDVSQSRWLGGWETIRLQLTWTWRARTGTVAVASNILCTHGTSWDI